MPGIFDIINSNNLKRQKLVLDQQKEQDNALILQEKMAGIQQRSLENEAIKLYDPSDEGSIDKVIGSLAKGGDTKGALDVMKYKNEAQHKKALTAQEAFNTDAKKSERVGGIAASMTDESSYQIGIMRMLNEQISPMAYGFSGSWTTDQNRIRSISQASMSAFQQADLKIKTTTEQIRLDRENAALRKEATTNANNESKAAMDERKQTQKETNDTELANIRKAGALTTFNAKKNAMNRVSPDDTKDANTIVGRLPEMEGVPPKIQAAVAEKLAHRAKNNMSKAMKFNVEEDEPMNYDEQILNEFANMKKSGEWEKYVKPGMVADLFGAKATGGYTPKTATIAPPPATPPSAQAATRPVAPVAVHSKAERDALKSGTEYMDEQGNIRKRP